MTLIPNEDGNDRPTVKPIRLADVIAGLGIAGLILYVGCLITGVI